MTKYMLLVMLLLLFGCSSAPDKQFKRSEYNSLALSLYAQAQRNRQLEKHDKALTQYQQALHFAQLKNNLHLIGIIKLKQAGILIRQKKIEEANTLIKETELIQKYEQPNLQVAILATQAKLFKATLQYEEALKIIAQIRQSEEIKNAQVKSIYYRWLESEISNIPLSEEEQQKDLDILTAHIKSNTSNNIEIYSYVLLRRAEYQVLKKDDNTKQTLVTAMQHFSDIELPNKLAKLYKLAAKYYSLMGQKEASQYYLNKANHNFINY